MGSKLFLFSLALSITKSYFPIFGLKIHDSCCMQAMPLIITIAGRCFDPLSVHKRPPILFLQNGDTSVTKIATQRNTFPPTFRVGDTSKC